MHIRILVYLFALCYNLCQGGAVSLVGTVDYQEGPKNPLKGISVKSLVLACFAQIRVGAGG